MIRFSKLEQVDHKEQSRMNEIMFFRIQIYDEIYGCKLLIIVSIKWKDCLERKECHKISKIRN